MQNIRTSSVHIHALLEKRSNTTDILFLQETHPRLLRHIPSTTSSEGSPLIGLPLHPDWHVLERPRSKFPNSKVAVYIHKRLLPTHFFTQNDSIQNENVLVLNITRIKDNASVSVANVYNSPSNKNATVKYLVDVLPTIPNLGLIQGDFNLHHSEWDSRANTNQRWASNLLLTTFQNDMSLIDNQDIPTFYNNHTASVLDLVFAHNYLLAHSRCEYHNVFQDRQPSDHSLITFCLSTNVTTDELGHQYIKPKSDEEQKFCELIAGALIKAAQSIDNGEERDVDTLFDTITNDIAAAWTTCAKTSKAGSNPTKWWNDDVSAAKDSMTAHPTRRNIYLYKKAIRRARQEYFETSLQEMSANRAPWQAVKWTKDRKPSHFSTIDNGGQPVQDLASLFDVFHNQFSSSLANHDNIDFDFIDSLADTPTRDTPAISLHEIKKALKTTSNKSAPGNDHVSWRHIKGAIAQPNAINALKTLYNHILNSGIWPNAFKQAVSVIIPKPGKDNYSLPKSFRPIALLTTLSKLFTKVIANRLQFDAIANDLLFEGQCGGVQAHSTIDAGLVLVDYVASHQNLGLHSSALVFDIAQFFPSLNHLVMVKTLQKLGYGPLISNLILSFFSSRKTHYKWGSHLSHAYDFSLGTPQGDCLSPILSALYIAMALKIVFKWSKPEHARSLFYVDDGVIFCSSLSVDQNCNTIAQALENIVALFKKIGLSIDFSKTQLQHFPAADPKQKRRAYLPIRRPSVSITVDHKTHCFQPVDHLRYLGFFLSPTLDFTYHRNWYTNKAFSSLRACNMIGNAHRGISPRARVQVYKTCILPILLYGLPLYYQYNAKNMKRHVAPMQRLQNVATKWIIGAFRTTPIGAREAIAGVPPIHIQANLVLRQLEARIASLPNNHILKGYQNAPTHPHLAKRAKHKKGQKAYLPFTHLVYNQSIDEEFDIYHHVGRPGCRPLDIHDERIAYRNMTHPPKGSDAFQNWLRDFKNARQKTKTNRDIVELFTDGSYHPMARSGTSALVVMHLGRVIHQTSTAVPAASSFDTELHAIHLAADWISNNAVLARHFHVMTDNTSAIQTALDTTRHSSQLVSVGIATRVLKTLDNNSKSTIVFSYCPSHVGIDGNEIADRLAANTSRVLETRKTLAQHRVVQGERSMTYAWRKLFDKSKGSQWLPLRFKGKPYAPKIRKKSPFVIEADMSPLFLTRLTRLITAHAPIADFSQRFFPNQSRICTTCPDNQTMTRRHILFHCNKYKSHITHDSIKGYDSHQGVYRFLYDNPSAFSFDDAPFDIH